MLKTPRRSTERSPHRSNYETIGVKAKQGCVELIVSKHATKHDNDYLHEQCTVELSPELAVKLARRLLKRARQVLAQQPDKSGDGGS